MYFEYMIKGAGCFKILKMLEASFNVYTSTRGRGRICSLHMLATGFIRHARCLLDQSPTANAIEGKF